MTPNEQTNHKTTLSVDKIYIEFNITDYQWFIVNQYLKTVKGADAGLFKNTKSYDELVWFNNVNADLHKISIGYKYTKITEKRSKEIKHYTRDTYNDYKESELRECVVMYNPNLSHLKTNNGKTLLLNVLSMLFLMNKLNNQNLINTNETDNQQLHPKIKRFHIARDFDIHINSFARSKGRHRDPTNYDGDFREDIEHVKGLVEDGSVYFGEEHKPGTTKMYNKKVELVAKKRFNITRNIKILFRLEKGKIRPAFRGTYINAKTYDDMLQLAENDIKAYERRLNNMTRIEYDMEHTIYLEPDSTGTIIVTNIPYDMPNIFLMDHVPDLKQARVYSKGKEPRELDPEEYYMLEALVLKRSKLSELKDHKQRKYKNLLAQLKPIDIQFSTLEETEKKAEKEKCRVTISNYANGLYRLLSSTADDMHDTIINLSSQLNHIKPRTTTDITDEIQDSWND